MQESDAGWVCGGSDRRSCRLKEMHRCGRFFVVRIFCVRIVLPCTLNPSCSTLLHHTCHIWGCCWQLALGTGRKRGRLRGLGHMQSRWDEMNAHGKKWGEKGRRGGCGMGVWLTCKRADLASTAVTAPKARVDAPAFEPRGLFFGGIEESARGGPDLRACRPMAAITSV